MAVYFIQQADNPASLIKIGRADHPLVRLRQIQIYCPVPLRIIGTLDGSSAEENRLHAQFHHLRHHGEWFEATSELLDYIGRHAVKFTDWPAFSRRRRATPRQTQFTSTAGFIAWILEFAMSKGMGLAELIIAAVTDYARSVGFGEDPPLVPRKTASPRYTNRIAYLRRNDPMGLTMLAVGLPPDWRSWFNRLIESERVSNGRLICMALCHFAKVTGYSVSAPSYLTFYPKSS